MLTAARFVPLLTSTIGAASFMSLGTLEALPAESRYFVWAISADGTAAIGQVELPTPPGGTWLPFVWTAEQGAELLSIPVGEPYAVCRSVNRDGSVIVGQTGSGPVRWINRIPEVLDGNQGGWPTSNAVLVSDDGDTIVFNAARPFPHPYFPLVWSEDRGFSALDQSVLGFVPRDARAISSDGRVVVGSAYNPKFQLYWAFRWSELGGLELLGSAPLIHDYESEASCVSTDGTTVWGHYGSIAMRWQGGTSTVLGVPDKAARWWPTDAAANGIIVGQSRAPDSDVTAVYWTPTFGALDLKAVLIGGYGLTQCCGWQLSGAGTPLISEDGQTLVGWGIDPCGKTRGWIARLSGPPLPKPQPECAGDANGDHAVDGADLSVLLSRFGQDACGCGAAVAADLNGDARVNGADLSVLLANFGDAC